MLSSLATLAEPVRHEFSTAGFIAVEDGGRAVWDFNVGWRFHKGPVEGAEEIAFDDSKWLIVNCPHGLELLPDNASIVAEGLIGGKVVAVAKRWPAKRTHRLEISVDYDGAPLVADGSDIVTVIASLVDEQGEVKRLGMEDILFEVSGEGRLLGSHLNGANPRKLEWGTAPCLVQATAKPGRITVKARTLFEGVNTPLPGEVSFWSVPSNARLLFIDQATDFTAAPLPVGRMRNPESGNDARLNDVGAQQTEFEHH